MPHVRVWTIIRERRTPSKLLLLVVLVCVLVTTYAPAVSRAATGAIKAGDYQAGQGTQMGRRLAQPSSATLSIGSGDVLPGDSITVALLSSLGPELLGAATIQIQYDPTVLHAISCSADPNAAFDMALCNPDFDTDKVKLTAISVLGVSQDVRLAEITFQAIGQGGQSSVLDLTASVFADLATNPISCDERDGQIHITLSATPTASHTPTDTPAPISTPTPTHTPTNTPAPTHTPTIRPTTTPIPTTTHTPTATYTPTNRPTVTPTSSATPTSSPTATRTSVIRPSPTSEATHTPTATSTSTPTAAPTDTAAATYTPTAPTFTPTWARTATPTSDVDELIVDDGDPAFSLRHVQDDWTRWEDPAGLHYGASHYYNQLLGTGQDIATWSFTVPRSGVYSVYAWWPADSWRPVDVPYTVHHLGGSTTVRVDQQRDGGRWNLLGAFGFDDQGAVTVSDDASSGRDIVADAVRLVHEGPLPSPTPTATDTPTITPTATATPTATPLTHVSPSFVYFSTTRSETVPGIGRIEDEDIVRYDVESGTYSLLFSGSARGLPRSADINALAVLPNGSMLMSFQDSLMVPGIGEVVDSSDLVIFDGAGFRLYLDGSDVGLTEKEEDIDALGLTIGGELVLSTAGSFSVNGLGGNGEDLILFYAASLGATTSGIFDMYVDGSSVELDSRSENVDGTCLVYEGTSSVEIYLTTRGRFFVPGLQGSGEDIFRFQPTSLGASTSGTFDPGMFSGTRALGMGAFDVDAIWIAEEGGTEATMVAPTASDAHSAESILELVRESILEPVMAWIPDSVRQWILR